METLIAAYNALVENVDTRFIRYLHDQIPWNSQLVAIMGARGVGKTTMMLQHIKLYEDRATTLFVMADNFYFSNHRLYDLAYEFYKHGGKHLFIDEIHKYPNWSREIKNIYDQLPQLKVVYSGSSILELERGDADLSRRALRYTLHGMSFREYFNFATGHNLPAYSLTDILAHKVEFPLTEERPQQWFLSYLKQGYYPFYQQDHSDMRLNGILQQVVEFDIPQFADMEVASIQKLRKMLYMLAQTVPFKPNMSKLERDLEIRRNTLPRYFAYLEKAGLLNILRTKADGIKLLEKVDKVYLNNPNIAYILSETQPNIGSVRETIFFAWTQVNNFVSSSPISDFEVDGYTFEIGGPNKGQSPIKDFPNAYIVKDDIEYAFDNVIPLWHFGFLY